MSDACDAFTIGQQVLAATGLQPAVFVIAINSGKVTVGNVIIAGTPVQVTFDCSDFFTGFYGLLDLLGIPHP